MATPYKVVFDAADPHAQARFWAEALGYVIEDNSQLIRSLLDQGAVTDADIVDVDGVPAFGKVPLSATPMPLSTNSAASARVAGCCSRSCPSRRR